LVIAISYFGICQNRIYTGNKAKIYKKDINYFI